MLGISVADTSIVRVYFRVRVGAHVGCERGGHEQRLAPAWRAPPDVLC